MRKVTLPLLGAAALTVGALLVQIGRKPEPRPAAPRVQDQDTASDDKALLERLRERGF